MNNYTLLMTSSIYLIKKLRITSMKLSTKYFQAIHSLLNTYKSIVKMQKLTSVRILNFSWWMFLKKSCTKWQLVKNAFSQSLMQQFHMICAIHSIQFRHKYRSKKYLMKNSKNQLVQLILIIQIKSSINYKEFKKD